jgi:hypothetical protein
MMATILDARARPAEQIEDWLTRSNTRDASAAEQRRGYRSLRRVR